MAKTKVGRNMSASNYLYKKLNWLVNKIETSSRGKISKRDLVIYSLIIIFILSVRFGGVIGAFTFVLAVATIWNIRITQGLLKQSKRAFEQSNMRSLLDITDGLMSYIIKNQQDIGTDGAVRNCKNRLLILARVNPQEAEKAWEALKLWEGAERKNTTGQTLKQLFEKEDADFKKEIGYRKQVKK